VTVIGESPAVPSVVQTLRDVSSAYRFECARGIPMSVHERYQCWLAERRAKLRDRSTSCRIGDLLRRIGAVDEDDLAEALQIQQECGRAKLLGETLIDLG